VKWIRVRLAICAILTQNLQSRIEELAQKSTEGELAEDERAEYASYVRANKFVAILKR